MGAGCGVWFLLIFSRLLRSNVERKHPGENPDDINLISDRCERMPIEVVEAVKAIVRTGKEAIVKKEHGRWLVLENGRRVVYKETEKRT